MEPLGGHEKKLLPAALQVVFSVGVLLYELVFFKLNENCYFGTQLR